MLGAAVAAVALSCAAPAVADVVVFQESGSTYALSWLDLLVPTSGKYRVEFSTSKPISYQFGYQYDRHWHVVVAPGQPNAGFYLYGNLNLIDETQNAFDAGRSFEFTIPEDWIANEGYLPGDEEWWGVVLPAGTKIHEENHAENPRVILLSDWSDEPFDYAVKVILLSPVPEPGTWAMMITGFGAVGLIARRRPRLLQTRPTQ